MSYLGKDIKKLGFGLMRLPQKGDQIDIEQGKEMVDLFMKAGFTYFDTAWVYEGSEEAAKKILVDRYPRESYQLATKLSAWAGCKDREEAVSQFEQSLERKVQDILTFICFITSADQEHIFMMILICGAGLLKRKKRVR